MIRSRLKGEPAVINRSSVTHADELLTLFSREASPACKGVIAGLRESFMQGSLIEQLGFSRE